MHIILLNKLRFDQISCSGRMYALIIWGAHVLRDREKVGNPWPSETNKQNHCISNIAFMLSSIIYTIFFKTNSCCCVRKSRAACAQSFALRQQATTEFTCHDNSPRPLVVTFNHKLISAELPRHDHSFIACSRHVYVWCCSSRTSRSWWITHLTQHHRRGCNNVIHLLLTDTANLFYQKDNPLEQISGKKKKTFFHTFN